MLCPYSEIVLICPRQGHNKKRKHGDGGKCNANHIEGNVTDEEDDGKEYPEGGKDAYEIPPDLFAFHRLLPLYLQLLSKNIVYQVGKKVS